MTKYNNFTKMAMRTLINNKQFHGLHYSEFNTAVKRSLINACLAEHCVHADLIELVTEGLNGIDWEAVFSTVQHNFNNSEPHYGGVSESDLAAALVRGAQYINPSFSSVSGCAEAQTFNVIRDLFFALQAKPVPTQHLRPEIAAYVELSRMLSSVEVEGHAVDSVVISNINQQLRTMNMEIARDGLGRLFTEQCDMLEDNTTLLVDAVLAIVSYVVGGPA